MDFQKIKEEIKNNPVCFLYLVKPDNKFKIIIKGDRQSEVKEKLVEIYNDNPNKFGPDDYFILAKLTFHTGQKLAQGGPLSVIFHHYAVDNNTLKNTMYIKNYKYKKLHSVIGGTVWFSKKWLEEFGWSYEYIDNLINRLITGKETLNLMITNNYHPKFTKKLK